jgi:hypothetical protein
MSPHWEFKPLARGDKIREATQGEFFSTDAIRNPAEAIVRESVQNSLDAATRGGPVRVLAAAVNSTVVAGENLTVGSTVWLPAESMAPGR